MNQEVSSEQSVNKPVTVKQDAIFISAVGIAYFLAYQIAFLLPDTQKVLMQVWPASGIGLGALLLSRRRLWPAILATLVLSGSVANLLDCRPPLACLGYMSSNIIESLGSALLMIRLCGGDPIRFTRVKEVAVLTFCAVTVNALTACIGAGSALLVSPGSSFWNFWRTWWICKGLGIILITPFMVTWVEFRAIIARVRLVRLLEIAALSGIWIFTVWYAFCPAGTKILFLPQPYPYLIVALLAWAALRFEQAVVTGLLLTFAIIAIMSAGIQHGPYWWGGADAAARLWTAQIFIAVIAIVGLLHTASWSETRRAKRQAEKERIRLNALADNLPSAAIYQLIRNLDGTIYIAYFSEGLERLTGISAKAALGNPAHVYDQIPGEDRKTLYALHRRSLESMCSIHEVIRLRDVDGSVRWINVSSTPRLLDDGRVLWDGLIMDVTESKCLGQSLAASEEKYRALFHSSDFGMLVSKVDGSEIIEVNATLCTMLGYAPGELVGRPSRCIWADPQERDEMIRLLQRDGFVNAFECRLATKTGDTLWCITSLHGPRGSDIINGSIINVTDRKKTEDALVRSEAKYRTIVENITDQLVIHDFDGTILDLNENAAAMLGYSRDELVGAGLEKIMPPRNASLIRERLSWMLERDIVEFESARLRKDGSVFLCEVHCKVVSREGKGVVQSFWRDISVRKKVEKTLRESEDKFYKLFHKSPLGILLTHNPDGPDGVIVDINEKLLKIVECSREEVIGKKVADLHILDEEVIRKGELTELGLPGQPQTLECTYRTKSGKTGAILKSLDRVIINDEPYQISSIMEITDLRHMQEVAAKNDRLESIGVLAGGIAHDLNNLLGGMYGYIEMAQMQLEGAENEKPLEYLDKALGIFERTRDLTRQLLTFAKGGSPVKKAGSLEAVVRGNAEFMLTGTPVTCTFSIPEPLKTCEFDENMIGQVIDNMVINAKQAMPEGGTVAIDLENVRLATGEIPLLKKGDYVRISIRDSGHGIPADLLPKIFDPFFTTKSTGSGLGLATCYSVIKKHKGIITVDSAEGACTTFHIFLPALPESTTATVPDALVSGNAERDDGPIGINRVLIMDDEEYMREVVGTMLAALDCSFEGVSNGHDALERLKEARDRQQPFDAVIMDLTIPGGMGGRETIGKLRIIDKNILAIAMSGYSEDPVMADPIRFGFDGCLAKPLRKTDLERELRRERT
jgi:PAS domain S-box-containing protein